MERPQLPDRSRLLIFLFFIRMGSVASYSVMFSTLSLYLVDYFGLSKSLASDMVGIFVAFVYILPTLGAVLGQRLLPYRILFICGVMVQILGALILAHTQLSWVYWGLSFFLMGNMVSALCINMLITQSYQAHEIVERKTAFLWNYSGMNAGFLLGYILSGFFQLSKNYMALFYWVAVFSAMAVLLMMIASKVLLARVENRNASLFNIAFTVLIMFSLSGLIHWIIKEAYLSKQVLLICSMGIFTLIFLHLYVANPVNRRALRTFLYFALLSVAFWSIYMLTPTSLMLFIQDYVNTNVAGLHAPPQWLDIIDASVVVIFTPLLASISKSLKKTRDYSMNAGRSFQIGFGVYSLGIVALLYAMYAYIPPINIGWVMSYMALQAIAEAFIGPSGYALIGDLLPEKMQGIATGLWMMTLGVAGLIASSISNLAFNHVIGKEITSLSNYQYIFMFILMLGLIVFITISLTQRFLHPAVETEK